MYYGSRSILGQIRSEVERPTGITTVLRPLVLGSLLILITAGVTYSVARWLITAGRIIGGELVGVIICTGALIYGVRIKRPLRFVWSVNGKQHKRTVISVLAVGGLACLIYLTGYWPKPSYPGGQFLWWVWQTVPDIDGGGVWAGIMRRPMQQVIDAATITWLRVGFLIVLPITLHIVRLLWYRYCVEIVYPSWSDGATPRGLRWLDPLGLLDIRLQNEEEKSLPIIPGAEAIDEGTL